jgi:hypothetical protein
VDEKARAAQGGAVAASELEELGRRGLIGDLGARP